MANKYGKRTPDFPAAGTVTGSDLFPLWQTALGMAKVTMSALASYLVPLVTAAQPWVDLPTGATVNLAGTSTPNVRFTGTTTITSCGTGTDGTRRYCRAAGDFTLTNGASLICPGGVNLNVRAGDTWTMVLIGTSTWMVEEYSRATGKALAGSVLQMVSTVTGALQTVPGSPAIPADDTIPQNTEGTQILSRAITPTVVGSTLEIEVIANAALSAANDFIVALFQDAVANALAVSWTYVDTAGGRGQVVMRWRVTTTSLVATTFTVRAGTPGAVALDINGSGGGVRRFGGVCLTGIWIREVAP